MSDDPRRTPITPRDFIALDEYIERKERQRKRRRLARRAGLVALTPIPGGWAFTYDKDWS